MVSRLRVLRTTLVGVAAIAAGLAQGCRQTGGIVDGGLTGGPMAAEARLVSQPQGGSNVYELSCSFEMIEIPGDGSAPVVVQVSWVAPCGTHKTEAFVFDGGSRVFESTYSEGGYPIGMTFWATIAWIDGRGQHRIQSDVAVCSVR